MLSYWYILTFYLIQSGNVKSIFSRISFVCNDSALSQSSFRYASLRAASHNWSTREMHAKFVRA